MAIAQTQPYSSAHSHIPGLFYYPQDPFHSLFPIRNIEMSKFLDKAGDAMSSLKFRATLSANFVYYYDYRW